MSNQAIAVVEQHARGRTDPDPWRLKAANLPARDRVFEAWLEEELVWLPERGMGYFPVRTGTKPYDAKYFDKYTGYRDLPTFEALNRARCELVARHAGQYTTVCDVGIGDGAFIEARGIRWTLGYDVNPKGVDWLKTNGAWCDPYARPVEAVSFWDCLEHIHDPAPLLANVEGWVFVSLPIVPGDGPPPKGWKHFRPDEHCWYFTRKGFIAWMREHGFECVEVNANETIAGREDVEAFAFRRVR